MTGRIGRYELIEKLARGGMGDVWLAHDPDLDREVAIKTIRHDIEGDDATERFLLEARAAARCAHPGIVTIHDFGVHEGQPFLVMERVHGETLRERVERSGPLPLAEVQRLGLSLCSALQHAHETGVLHRDVTPSNVFLDRQDHARLLDFGLVRALGAPTSERSTQAILGTPAYVAPEQAFGAMEEVDARADLYGLGATLHFALTGKPPFSAPTLLALLRQVEEADVPRSGAGAAVDTLLRRAMAKTPDERFGDAGALHAALVTVTNDAPPPRRERPATPSTRRKIIAGLAVATACAVALTVGLGPGEAVGDLRQRIYAETFDLHASAWADDPRAAALLAGHAGAAAASGLVASPRGWVAQMLCSPAGMRRYTHADAFTCTFRPPLRVDDDGYAEAGLTIVDEGGEAALEALDELVERDGGSHLHDYLEGHALLSLSEHEFDHDRATAWLEHVRDDAEAGSPIAEFGLFDLVRQRLGDEAPHFFDVGVPHDAIEHQLAAAALLLGMDRFGEAADIAERIWRSQPDDDFAVAHFAWLRMLAAFAENHALDLSPLQADLERIVRARAEGAAYPAAVVLTMHAILNDRDAEALAYLGVVHDLAEDERIDVDRLPYPADTVALADLDLPTCVLAAKRNVHEAFDSLERARALAGEIADGGATDVEDGDDRRQLQLDNALAQARLATDDATARAHVLAATSFGLDEERLHDEDDLERFFDDPEIQQRLSR